MKGTFREVNENETIGELTSVSFPDDYLGC